MNPLYLVLVGSAVFCAASVALYASGVTSHPLAPTTQQSAPRLNLKTLFLVAFVVRCAVGFLLLVTDWNLILAPDSESYILLGQDLAAHWHRGIPMLTTGMRPEVANFVRLNAAVYYVFGRVPAIIVVICAVAGAWTSLLATRTASLISGDSAATRAGWLVALFPSVVLWSALPLRDAFTILAVTGCAYSTIRLKEAPSILLGAQLAAWLALAGLFRGYLFILLAVGVAAAFIAGSRSGFVRNGLGAILAVGVVVVLAKIVGFGEYYLDYVDLERIAELRRGMTYAAESAFLEQTDISTPGRALLYLPIGLVYFLWGPFPWDLRGLRQWLTLPEMLFWYYLSLMMWPGLRAIARKSASYVWLIATIVGTICVTYALISGNLGTAYRHRAQVVPLMLVVAGVGWDAVRERRSNARLSSKRVTDAG